MTPQQVRGERPAMYVQERGVVRPPRRRGAPRVARGAVIAAVVALVASGCGMLGLDTGPADVTATTSAAAAVDAATGSGAITVPTLASGTTTASTPTPWQSLTTTATPTTTEVQITAPTITRSVTFATLTSVTKPTIAAPTAIASPPPACYKDGTCRVQASAPVAGGKLEVINEAVSAKTVAVYTTAGHEPTALSVARLAKPAVDCSGSYCLLTGTQSGLHFGSLILVKGGALHSVSGVATSLSPLRLLPGSSPVVAGTYRFDSYGALLDDAPIAARTWAISGGRFVSTGCGQPYLYATPPVPAAAVAGACTGTPQIAGWGKASANPLTSLSGFVTPSGNIQCGLLPNDRLVCGAKKNTISVPTCTEPATKLPAELRGLRVTMGRSGVVLKDDCIGYDLIGLPQTKIGYGRLAVARGFVCEVMQDGVTCTAPTGRGFTLNRSSLKSF